MKILLEISIEGEKVTTRVIPNKVKKPARSVEKAILWLRGRMVLGPVQAVEVILDGEAAGIHKQTLYKAKRILGITHYPVGYRAKDGWTWELRNDKQTDVAQLPDRVESGLDGARKEILGVAFGNGLQDWEKPRG